MLFGYGASAINPYLVNEVIEYHYEFRTSIINVSIDSAINQILMMLQLQKGYLKIMNKIGISTLNSYRGSQIFEALGLKNKFYQ